MLHLEFERKLLTHLQFLPFAANCQLSECLTLGVQSTPRAAPFTLES